MTSGIYKVTATFQNAGGGPVTGPGIEAGLRDKDRFFDDKLGVCTLNDRGEAEFIFTAEDIDSIDSRGETRPDLYFVLWRNGEEIFRSEVFANVDFDAIDPVTGRKKGLTQAFGPFSVNV
jgi:hypothetical protein